MAYLEMDITDLSGKLCARAVGLGIDRFLADLDFTANGAYEDCDGFPLASFHDKMKGVLDAYTEGRLKLPYLFSVNLDRKMSMLGCPHRYTFLVVDKAFFKRLRREYGVDRETLDKCLSHDTDFIVLYTGMSRQD